MTLNNALNDVYILTQNIDFRKYMINIAKLNDIKIEDLDRKLFEKLSRGLF